MSEENPEEVRALFEALNAVRKLIKQGLKLQDLEENIKKQIVVIEEKDK